MCNSFLFFCSFSPPPGVSAAQRQYDKERFRSQPGRIEDYTLGRGSIAQKEAREVILYFVHSL